MRRIAFHIHNLHQGGAERVVSNLANEFASKGYEVYVATEEQEAEGFRLDERVHRVHVGLRDGDESKGRVTKFLLRVKYLREFVQEVKPDVLIPFCRRENYRALMATRGVKVDYGTSRHVVPVIVCCRTIPGAYYDNRSRSMQTGHYDHRSDRIQIKWLFPGAAGAVFQTTGQKEFFKPYLQDNSTIILNPVNSKYVGVELPKVRDKAVVHHARLKDFKNQEMLCRAFVKVHAQHPDYVLRIYGEDSGDGTKEILDRIIAENHAEDWILLMGGSYDLERQLPHGEVYAFSSDWEGLPNSLIEAMSLGLPCVATDCPCGGPAELIRDGENGLLVPYAGDGDVAAEDAMAAGICRLIEDRALAERIGANARKTIEERCNPETIFRQWSDYIETVIARAERQ